MKKRRLNMRSIRGFTLIEMMVAVSIFAIVMVVGVSALLSLVAVNSRAQGINSVMNNLNSSLETMARSLRTGTTYHCGSNNVTVPLSPQDCAYSTTPKTFIGFIDSDGTQTYYRYNANQHNIQRSTEGTPWVAITAPEVTIDDATKFYVTGSSNTDGSQPRILIYVHGSAKVQGDTTTFTAQTGITQRILDIP